MSHSSSQPASSQQTSSCPNAPLPNSASPFSKTESPLLNADSPLPDSNVTHWVNTLTPVSFRPYLRLMRMDRPIGTWLLLIECWLGVMLATLASGSSFPLSQLLLFAAGALIIRGAATTYNDLLDRDIDEKIDRTRHRPLACGQISIAKALILLLALTLAGLLILLQFNSLTMVLGLVSLIPAGLYPLMKRCMPLPQLIQGCTYACAILMGWTACQGAITLSAGFLFIGEMAWVFGRDTIYALQDKEEDLLLGLKSAALTLSQTFVFWLGVVYLIACLCFSAALYLIPACGIGSWLGLSGFCLHLLYQWKSVRRLESCKEKDELSLKSSTKYAESSPYAQPSPKSAWFPKLRHILQMLWRRMERLLWETNSQNPLSLFRSNKQAGWILFTGFFLDYLLQ